MSLRAAWLALVAACGGAPPPPSCADALQGTYVAPDGGRWMILDNRPQPATLEAYPLFPDAADPLAPRGTAVAPRVIDLRAGDGHGFAGEVMRRYTSGGHDCDGRAPAHVTACTADGLELVLSDPAPPVGSSPCAFGPARPSRHERWRREAVVP